MTMSFARPSPTSRASRCVPPEPGIIPIVASGSAICTSVGRDAEVARERELEPDPEDVALEPCDHRLRAALRRGDVLRELRDHPRRARQEPRDVAAGGELAARAGQHHEPHRLVPVELGEDGGELVARGHRDAVELARARRASPSRRRARRRARPGTRRTRSRALLRASDSSRSTRRRIFPEALFGSDSTRRYSRGRLKRASGDARQWASSSSGVASPTTTATTRLPEPVVRRADHRHLAHARMAREHVLDLGRMDVLAARDDHVVEPAVDPEVAVRVEVPGVAGVVPAVAERLRVGVGPVPVAGERLVAGEVRADLAVLLEPQPRAHRRAARRTPACAAWSRPIEKV